MPSGWISAGAATLGVGENIAANNSAKAATKQNNATAAQLAGAQGSMLTQAEQVAQQPFQAYTGTLTAPMSGNEQQGYSLASKVANDGTAQADNAQATQLAGQVANNGWSAGTAQKYMDPYTSAVTDVATAAANKNYLQNLAGLQTAAAGSGAFGNGREAIEEGELAGQNQLNIGNLTATGNANAYNTAISTWQADNQNKINAANAYEQAGQDVTNMNSDQISDLMKTGGVSQVIAQTDLNNQYNQFLRQQGWSAQQLQSLISAVGTGKGGGGTTATPAVQSNTANQLLGLGSTIAGLFGGSSNSDVPTIANSAPSTNTTNSVDLSALNNATSGAGSNIVIPGE